MFLQCMLGIDRIKKVVEQLLKMSMDLVKIQGVQHKNGQWNLAWTGVKCDEAQDAATRGSQHARTRTSLKTRRRRRYRKDTDESDAENFRRSWRSTTVRWINPKGWSGSDTSKSNPAVCLWRQ